jgi:hypothetical protein
MGTIKRWSRALIRSALQRPVWTGGLKVSAVVGTLLNLVNQAPLLIDGTGPSLPGALLNYLIPFCVSVYSGACIDMRNCVTRPPDQDAA